MGRQTLACLMICVLLCNNPIQAEIVVPGSNVEGKTIASWTGDWWNWLVKDSVIGLSFEFDGNQLATHKIT